MCLSIREQTVETNGIRMNCIRFGRGMRTLLLISGLSLRDVRGPEAAFGLWYLYRSFGDAFTVYCFDRRENLPEGFTVRDMAEDIAAGMEALSLRDACVLGVSQGGMIAQYLALGHPKLVSRLVLGVTASRTNDSIRENILRWDSFVKDGNLRAVIADYTERTSSERTLKKYRILLPVLVRTMKMMDPARFRVCLLACLTCDTYEALPDISCPVLVLGGAKDTLVTGAASLEIAERIGCPVHLYENGTHAVYEEEAKDFNRRVREFFQA